MFKNLQKTKLSYRLLMGGALLAAGVGMYSCKDKYDLDSDDNQPSGLTSVYDYLQNQGTYSNYLHLIDDLGQAEILRSTGSKTLFVADDEAFKAFFQNNPWKVQSYDELTLAQKKLLLNGSMLDNPYTTNMLSSAESVSSTNPTPVRGEVFRRSTSMSLMDSVLVISTSGDPHFPDNSFTRLFKQRNDRMVVFNDNSTPAPIIHFTDAYLTANKIESSDIDFLYNNPEGTRKPEEVYVNDAKVVEANIYCKNGFVHKVDKVITPLPNMADIIRDNPNYSYFNSILERFQSFAVIPGTTEEYNKQYGTSLNNVYTLRYFSNRTWGTREGDEDKYKSTAGKSIGFDSDFYGQVSSGKLKFDPAWNGYMPELANPRVPMMEDMGVMIVPNNKAIEEWWLDEHGEGRDIKNRYAPNENDVIKGLQMTPISTLEKLVNVNMLTSFNASVPSHFSSVLNDANEPLMTDDEVADPRSVFKHVDLACNGAVYESSKVFAPTSYSSVLFPVVLDTTSFKIIMKAIETLDYDKYLNSMASRYTFFVPAAGSDGSLTYIDPVTYGATNTNMWKFKFDDKNNNIYAEVYDAVLGSDGWTAVGDRKDYVAFSGNKAVGAYNGVSNKSGSKYLADRLEDLLDNIIVLGDLEQGKEFYRTKGNKYIRVVGNIDDASSLKVYGAGQADWNTPLSVKKDGILHKKNGTTYVMDGIIQGGTRTVFGSLGKFSTDHEDKYSDFLEVLELSGAVNKKDTRDVWISAVSDFSTTSDGNLFNLKKWKDDLGAEVKPVTAEGDYKAAYLLNNYHYTIYAPTNEAMSRVFAMGLPSLDEVKNCDTDEYKAQEDALGYKFHRADSLKEVYLDFVKYHIQDNAVFAQPGESGGTFETGRVEFIPSTKYNETLGIIEETGKFTTGRPYKLQVSVSGTSMSVTDNCGRTANVVDPNITATEYWIEGANTDTGLPLKPWSACQLNNSSFAVIHGISEALLFDNPGQFKYVQKELDSNSVKPRK